MPWYPDVCLQLIKENKVTCFEQVIVQRQSLQGQSLQEGDGAAATRPYACYPGFFGQAEAALFRQHTIESHRLLAHVNNARGPALATPEEMRMLVSQRAKMRRVLNLDALVSVAQDMALDVIMLIMENLPFREQVRQWVIANVVVATNGAALINLVLMPPGSFWIEIPFRYPVQHTGEPCLYQAHAAAVGVKHHALCDGECLDIATLARRHPHMFDKLDWLYMDNIVTTTMVATFRTLLSGILVAAARQTPAPLR